MLNLRIKSSMGNDIIEYLAIMMILLSSGSMFFTIMNLLPTLILLLVFALMSVFVCKCNKQALKKNFVTFAVILVCYGLNLVFNTQYTGVDNNTYILLIRLISLVLIQSSIKEQNYLQKYVRIIYYMCIVSLLCFAFTMLISPKLPLLIEESHDGLKYMYSFYHTVGYRTVYQRNAGVFWEAPAFAIFIAIAMIYLVCRPDVFHNEKHQWRFYLVFIITIVTTLSVYAYVYLAGIAVLMLISSGKFKRKKGLPSDLKHNRKRKFYYIIGAFLLLCVFIYVEARFQLISHKLINRQGSFTTRFNDTYHSLVLASKRLLTGYGVSNYYTVRLLQAVGVVNNSNGLAILLLAVGLPMLLLAAFRMARVLKRFLKLQKLQYFIVLCLFGLFHFSEHLWLYTLFISFLFTWRTEKGLLNRVRRNTNGKLAETSVD